MASALAVEPVVIVEAAIRPSTISEKYSVEPNSIAKFAISGANSIRSMMPMLPPAKDAIAAITSATPARPCCAIG